MDNHQLALNNNKPETQLVHQANVLPSLTARIAALREQYSTFLTVLGACYDEQSDVINRAEQVDAALQRLEWAIDRAKIDNRFRTALNTSELTMSTGASELAAQMHFE